MNRQVGTLFLNRIQPTNASYGPNEGTAVGRGREDKVVRRQL